MATIISNVAYANDFGETIYLYDRAYSKISKVVGGSGNDIFRGNSLNDILIGGSGDDQLWGGGLSADTLTGGIGDDAYWWGKGDGHDWITDSSDNSQDALFLYNVSLYGNSAGNSNGNLHLQLNDNSTIDLQNWYKVSPNARVQSFVYSDNVAYAWNNGNGATVYLSSSIYEATNVHKLVSMDNGDCNFRGGHGDDILIGGNGNDQLWGGIGGNDTLTGGGGTNTFWFGKGDGHDIISDGGTSNDTVNLYNITDATLSHNQNDLVLTTSQGDSLTLSNWYNNKNQLNSFLFSDGTVKKVGSSGWEPATSDKIGFNIEIDYDRYDTSGFFANHPERKAVVKEACEIWESILKDEFADVPAGTLISLVNPNTGSTDSLKLATKIDDLRIYLGSYTSADTSLGLARMFSVSQTGNAALDNRYNSYDNIEPWVGSVAFNENYAQSFYFDPTPSNPYDDSVPSDKYDFLHILLHEFGHVLGMGPQNAGSQYMTNVNGINYFTGPHAEQVYGGPVPLDFSSGTHIAKAATMDSIMKPSLNMGQRTLPTALDKAFLADIGYQIA